MNDDLTAIECRHLLNLLLHTQLGARTRTNVIRDIQTKLRNKLKKYEQEAEALGIKSLNFRSKD